MSRNYILGALVALATVGCATTHPTADKTVAAAATTQHCVKDTGSYIKRRPDQECSNRPGTSYTQQELEDTGRISTAEALRELDPRIQ